MPPLLFADAAAADTRYALSEPLRGDDGGDVAGQCELRRS
jgi:hypothetical protein